MSNINLVAGLDAIPHPSEQARAGLPAKYSDCRPAFLTLSQTAFTNSKDHEIRPVITLPDAGRLPWGSGYAETINGGKSAFVNEDNAAYHHEVLGVLTKDPKTGEETKHELELWYFGVFDGHAGECAAIFAAKNCHKHICHSIRQIGHLLVKEGDEVYAEEEDGPLGPTAPPVSKVSLITGALESAFISMDDQIKRERNTYHIKGGCTAVVAVFLLGKLFVTNAGDSRCVLYRRPTEDKSVPPVCQREVTHAFDMEIIPMSFDFTPETDRHRLQYIALLQPKLLRGLFGRIQWQRRLRKRDLDKRVLCRDAHMDGWAFRTVTEEDVGCAPMLAGEGKRSRLLATIGTSRGFGDHDLVGPGDIHIKPFLTAAPEVRVYDLCRQHGKDDVLVIASDGLWERLTNEDVAEIINSCTTGREHPDSTSLYTHIAQQLVLSARGNFTSKGWRTSSDLQASYDDITAFVLPMHVHNKVAVSSVSMVDGSLTAQLDTASADKSTSATLPDAAQTASSVTGNASDGKSASITMETMNGPAASTESATSLAHEYQAASSDNGTELTSVLADREPADKVALTSSPLPPGTPVSGSLSLSSFVVVENNSTVDEQ